MPPRRSTRNKNKVEVLTPPPKKSKSKTSTVTPPVSRSTPTDDSSCSIVQDNTLDITGTYKRGDLLSTMNKMVAAFGDGNKEGDYKTTLEWHFRDGNGNKWAVYDWKRCGEEDGDDELVFNIGGASGDPKPFRDFLQQKVNPSHLTLRTKEEEKNSMKEFSAKLATQSTAAKTTTAATHIPKYLLSILNPFQSASNTTRLEVKGRKFWQISINGSTVNILFGKVRTDGQAQTKSFASSEEAQVYVTAQIAAKKKKGYKPI